MSIRDLVPRLRKNRGKNIPVTQKHEQGMLSLQNEMNRLFDNFFNDFSIAPSFGWGGSESGLSFSPKVDVSETDKDIKISAEVPGMDEKDIAIEIDDNVVTIRGEKKEEHEDSGKDWYCKEQSYGSFHRTIPLPAEVDSEKAKAKLKKGKLTVTVAKKKESRSSRKTIDIEYE